MKGVVFTEFLEMVEDTFGYEMVDTIISESNLSNDGAYTSVGTYNHMELVEMIASLHGHSNLPVDDLIRLFGNYFFNHLLNNYRVFFDQAPDLFTFLESIHGHIHVEVKKLYADAELPSFRTKELSPIALEMIYSSERKLGDFAHGLMEKAANHFGETVNITKEPMNEDGSVVKFIISKLS